MSMQQQTFSQLANKNSADKHPKHGDHDYCDIYDSYFDKYRDRAFNLLELGTGGYHYSDRGGAGARTFRDYFERAFIYSIDYYPKIFKEVRINFLQISQDDKIKLEELCSIIKPFIVIDDASHINELTMKSFQILFKELQQNGIYVIEDTHTSYWKENYNGSDNVISGNNVQNYFKLLSDYLNQHVLTQEKKDFIFSELKLTKEILDEVKAVHFYKEMIFILKK